jgi:preprotein translocase subunit YajC
MNMDNLWILAQATGGVSSTNVTEENQLSTSTGGPNDLPKGKQPQQGPGNSWIFLIAVMAIMVVMMFRAPQKQKQERKKIEQSLERNDKVVTIGGIIGVITDIKEEEVTLKIDESNNTKIKIQRRAIGRNLSKEKT